MKNKTLIFLCLVGFYLAIILYVTYDYIKSVFSDRQDSILNHYSMLQSDIENEVKRQIRNNTKPKQKVKK